VVDVYGYGDRHPKTFEYEFYRLCIGGRSLTNDVLYDLARNDVKVVVDELVAEFDEREMIAV